MAYQGQEQKFNPTNYSCFICDQKFDDSTSPTWERWRKLDENRRAHPHCFKCDMCQAQITGKYHEKQDGSFYCIDNGCVKKLYGDDAKIVSWNDKQKDEYYKYVDERYCFICQSKLDGAYMADSDGNKYHKACFKCQDCQIQLSDAFVRDGTQLWCKSCRIQMKTKEMQQMNQYKNDNPQQGNQNQYNQSPFGKPQ
eukprot:217777_1